MTLNNIGILTVGGDCSGLNSIIRAAHKRSQILGYSLLGIKRGFTGLCEGLDFVNLSDKICDDSLLTTSGSVLYSDAKSLQLMVKSGLSIEQIKNSIMKGYHSLGLKGLIYIGGDGSLSLLNELLVDNEDLHVVAVPKTIDNDIAMTEFAIGFKTAVEVASEALWNIKSTAKSHERVIVVEVMGRGAGFIAMNAGVASGADVVLVPEFCYKFENVKKKIKECYASGKNHGIIVVAESVEAEELHHEHSVVAGIKKYDKISYCGIGRHLERKLQEEGFDARSVVLGHVQRGGKTAIDDRVVGSGFGVMAVNMLAESDFGKFLYYSSGRIKPMPIKDLLQHGKKKLEKTDMCVEIANDMGIYIGEL